VSSTSQHSAIRYFIRAELAGSLWPDTVNYCVDKIQLNVGLNSNHQSGFPTVPHCVDLVVFGTSPDSCVMIVVVHPSSMLDDG